MVNELQVSAGIRASGISGSVSTTRHQQQQQQSHQVSILPCCVNSHRQSVVSNYSWPENTSIMGAEEVTEICDGVLDKKVDYRRLPIGPAWKRKYGVLSSDGLRLYRTKSKKTSGGSALRTIPLCHIRAVARLQEDESGGLQYFSLETEQGETMTFRCREGTGWVAQIQIQLIHYKNRQDIMRYKQLNNSIQVAESAMQRLRGSPTSESLPHNNYVQEPTQVKSPIRGCRTVVLPNDTGVGIGITVIPLNDGRVVVNRVLEGGPAMRLGVIGPRDQIVAANGLRVTSVEMLSEVVRSSPNTVSLIVKPRISKPSPTLDDPKRFIQKGENPEYINTATTGPNAKMVFEKGNLNEKQRTKHSPRHFRFT